MKQRIHISLISIAAVVLLSIPTIAAAQSATTGVGTRSTAATDPVKQMQRFTRLKDKANKEIDRRVAALKKLINKILQMKHISNDEKAAFTKELQDTINSLTQLKAKIASDTDITTLRTDVHSIILDYRIFALYKPKMAIVVGAAKVQDVVDDANAIIAILQTEIQQQPGANQAALQSTLTDMQTEVNDAKQQAVNALTMVTPLTPAGSPGNKPQLAAARDLLKKARDDFKLFRQHFAMLRQQLKKQAPVGAMPLNTAVTPSITAMPSDMQMEASPTTTTVPSAMP